LAAIFYVAILNKKIALNYIFALMKAINNRVKVINGRSFLLAILLFSISSSIAQKDPTTTFNKGFKSLFINNYYDSTKPYNAQLNPRAISFVQEYIRKQGKELDKMKAWGKSYFNLYDGILKQYGIPDLQKSMQQYKSYSGMGISKTT
jgi:membrane-bound lytic murein transglycosylase D